MGKIARHFGLLIIYISVILFTCFSMVMYKLGVARGSRIFYSNTEQDINARAVKGNATNLDYSIALLQYDSSAEYRNVAIVVYSSEQSISMEFTHRNNPSTYEHVYDVSGYATPNDKVEYITTSAYNLSTQISKYEERLGVETHFDTDQMTAMLAECVRDYSYVYIVLMNLNTSGTNNFNVGMTGYIGEQSFTSTMYLGDFNNDLEDVVVYDKDGKVVNSIQLDVDKSEEFYVATKPQTTLKTFISKDDNNFFALDIESSFVSDVLIPNTNILGTKLTLKAKEELNTYTSMYLYGYEDGNVYSNITDIQISANTTSEILEASKDDFDILLPYGTQYEYSHSSVCPDVTVQYLGNTLNSLDYTVEYRDNKSVGTGQVIVTLDSSKYNLVDSEGNIVTTTFDIHAIDLTNKTVYMTYDKVYEYEFAKFTPKVHTVMFDGKELGSTEYIVGSVEENIVGDTDTEITFIGNYTGRKTISIIVNPLNLQEHQNEVELVQDTVYFSGHQITKEDFNFRLKYKGNILTTHVQADVDEIYNAGRHSVTVTGKDEYVVGECTKYAHVTPYSIDMDSENKFLSFNVIYLTSNKVYTGKPITLDADELLVKYCNKDVQITIKQYMQGEQIYSVAYSNNVNAGVANVTITFLDGANYSGELSAEFIISKGTYKAEDEYISMQDKSLSIRYVKNLTLQDIQLDANWEWSNPTIELSADTVGTNYQAVYNRDKVNYDNYSTLINVVVEKGEREQQDVISAYNSLQDIECTYSHTLSLQYLQDNLLDNRFAFDVDSNKLGENLNATVQGDGLGYKVYSLYYKEDSNYLAYYSANELTIKVIVNKSDIAQNLVPSINTSLGFKYTKDLSSDTVKQGFEQLNIGFAVYKELDIHAGDVKVDYAYNFDKVNYNDYLGTTYITIQKGDYTSADKYNAEKTIKNYIQTNYASGIKYDPNKTLSSITVPSEYSWLTPNIIYTKGNPVYKMYYCDDTINFNPLLIDCAIVVISPSVELKNITATDITYGDSILCSHMSADLYIDGALCKLSDYGVLVPHANTLSAGLQQILVSFVPIDTNYDTVQGSASINVKQFAFSLEQINTSSVLPVGKAIEVEYDGLDHSKDVINNASLLSKFPEGTVLTVKRMNIQTGNAENVSSVKDAGMHNMQIVPVNPNYAFSTSGTNGVNYIPYVLVIHKYKITITAHNKSVPFGISEHAFTNADYTIDKEPVPGDSLNVSLYVDCGENQVGNTTPAGEYPLCIYHSNLPNYDITTITGVYKITPKVIHCSSASAMQNLLNSQKLTSTNDVAYAVNQAVNELELPSNVGYTLKITCNGQEVSDFSQAGEYVVRVCLNSANYELQDNTFTFTVQKDYSGVIYITVASIILLALVGFILFLFIRNAKALRKEK